MTESATEHSGISTNEPADRRRSARARFGIGLILVSGVLWFSLFGVPFLPLSVTQKAALGAALFAGVQIAWWAGVAIAGPQTVQRLWSFFKRSEKRDKDAEPLRRE